MNEKYKNFNVTIVVLGDIGRSPRMQYHALSFAEHNFNVDIIGYEGSNPIKKLSEKPNTTIITMKPVPELKVPKLFSYLFKTMWQTITLLMALIFKRRSHFVMVQNPPAIPTMFVCWVYSLIFRSKFIIDWHNYANSIMALTLGENHKLVKLARWMESYFGRKAVANFCVTRTMQSDLLERWGIKAHVLYDRPPEIFKPISLNEKHDLFLRLSKNYPELGTGENETIFTKVVEGKVTLKDDRPGFIISSTSWTEDEDFSVLLNALKDYEENVELRKLPDLICVITGKGPLKEYYSEKISQEHWKHVKVITPWLEDMEDYARLLASADLGISLHTSSSGLDLPMKVVDMFGCNLPVCAYNFKCLHELVKNEQNSFVFNDSKELSEQMLKWFTYFPRNENQKKLNEQFRMELQKFSNFRWKDNWDINVLPVIQDLIKK